MCDFHSFPGDVLRTAEQCLPVKSLLACDLSVSKVMVSEEVAAGTLSSVGSLGSEPGC